MTEKQKELDGKEIWQVNIFDSTIKIPDKQDEIAKKRYQKKTGKKVQFSVPPTINFGQSTLKFVNETL